MMVMAFIMQSFLHSPQPTQFSAMTLQDPLVMNPRFFMMMASRGQLSMQVLQAAQMDASI
jgi:hypothetical protein